MDGSKELGPRFRGDERNKDLRPALRQHAVDHFAQRARGGGRIGRERQRGDDGDTVGAGGDHRCRIGGIDAGDTDDRDFRRAAALDGGNARKPFRADRGILLRLRERRVDAADARIVDQTDGRGFGRRDAFD